MDVSKLAYHQVDSMEEEENGGKQIGGIIAGDNMEEDDDKTNSRDVGHNIYILAHQVTIVTNVYIYILV